MVRLIIKNVKKRGGSACEPHGFDIPVNAKISELDVGVQQKVEILKALYLNANLLIMDEPTAVLTPQESDKLMEFVKSFTDKGNSVIFITHKLKEVMQVADRIIVMRNGVVCGDLKCEDTNESELSRLMIGKRPCTATKRDNPIDSNVQKVCLSVKDVAVEVKGGTPLLRDISF